MAAGAPRAWDAEWVKILLEDQHRALAFVECCNTNGYLPTSGELAVWLASPSPRGAKYEMPGWESIVTNLDLWLSSSVRGKKLSDAESPIEHLLRLRWLEHTGEGRAARLSITPLGRALLNGAERSQEAEPDLSVVVLSGKDPLAYPALIGHLATLQDGLFIDPFLGLVQLHELILSTQFSRFLITDKANASGKRTAMATYLRSGSVSRSVDVRAATGIHDRMVLSDTESFTLGTSLNGVGKTTTVLSPLPHAAAKALRAEMESAWAAATPLIPEEDVEAANE